MNFSFWNDQDRWFVPRRLGFGYTLNFKYVARRLGLIKSAPPVPSERLSDDGEAPAAEISREERMRKAIDDSKYEK